MQQIQGISLRTKIPKYQKLKHILVDYSKLQNGYLLLTLLIYCDDKISFIDSKRYPHYGLNFSGFWFSNDPILSLEDDDFVTIESIVNVLPKLSYEIGK